MADLDLSRARGITIRQPWASAFTRGPIHLRKSVENRPRGWPTGTYLIHAGKAWDGSGSHDPQIVAWNGGIAVPDMARFPLGAVLGVARLVDCRSRTWTARTCGHCAASTSATELGGPWSTTCSTTAGPLPDRGPRARLRPRT